MESGRIFISYRRDDAMAWGIALLERLNSEFGDSAFMDIDDIEPGDVFPDRLATVLESAGVVIVLVGARWCSVLAARAATDERDWVVHEIKTALEQGSRVIPVLVDKARMPRAEELPDDIKALSSQQGHEIRGSAFSRDFDDLIEWLRTFRERDDAAELAAARASSRILDTPAWDTLLRRVKSGACVPVVGPGAAPATVSEVDLLLSEAGGLVPTAVLGGNDLPRIAQAVSVGFDRAFPRDALRNAAERTPSASTDALDALARLAVPLFLTTSFDAALATALKSGGREPIVVEPARRSRLDGGIGLGVDSTPSDFSSETPTVLHLFGRFENATSMTLTEDEFFDLLIRMSREQGFFDAGIRDHLAMSSLLFVGFRLDDWRFRLLLRGLNAQLSDTGVASIAVLQLDPADLPDGHDEESVTEFIERYFSANRGIDMRAYVGSVDDFSRELESKIASASGSRDE